VAYILRDFTLAYAYCTRADDTGCIVSNTMLFVMMAQATQVADLYYGQIQGG
jgi:hypothetical protein